MSEEQKAPEAAPQPPAQPVMWQYRWLNPENDPDVPQSMLDWETVMPRDLSQSMDDRLQELRGYRYNGKICYEVRPLYAAPPAPAQPTHEPPAQLDDAAAIVRKDRDCEAEWEREFKEVGTAAEWRRLLQQTRALTVDARHAGRAEALEILLRTDADSIGDYIGTHAIGDTGDYGEHWLADKLRALFHVDDDNPMESLLETLDAAYWMMVWRSNDHGSTDDAAAIVRQLVEALETCRIRSVSEWGVRHVTPIMITGAIKAAQAWLEGK